MGSTIIEQDFPYDILKRGQRDASRHNRRVKEAAKKQLKDIISQQDIISSEKNRKIKVRLKHLDQYRFIHNRDRIDNVGRDQFDDLEDGEVISKPSMGKGSGNKAGQDKGEEIFESEFTIEQITDMMMEELNLPDLDEKKRNEIVSDVLEYTDRRKVSGVYACLDKKKTILANIARRAREGKTRDETIPIINDDLRFRTWNITEEKHSNAVVFLMMDRSGSMWEDKIYAVKALYFWIVQFLRRRYDRVEIKFISHDWVAREMEEKDFFSIAEGGGTKISSAYELCRDMVKHNYPSSMWNIYCFHASDGDSWGDESYCIDLVKEILDFGAVLFAYSEINIDNWRDDESDLYQRFMEAAEERDGILASSITELSDILEALQLFLRHSIRKSYA